MENGDFRWGNHHRLLYMDKFTTADWWLWSILNGSYFTSSDPHPDILFRYSIWHAFWHSFWHYILTYVLRLYLAFLFGILFDTCSGPGVAHSSRSWRYGVQVQAWPTASLDCHMARRRRQTRTKKENEERRSRSCTLLKSRDPHLADGEEVLV